MRLLDDKFLQNKRRYVFQCTVAAVFFMLNMLILNVVANEAVMASIGATSFIIFTMPHRLSSRPRIILGGYFLGGIAGSLCQVLLVWNLPYEEVIVPGIAVGLSIFLMVVFNMEHPPAAAFALGLIIDRFSGGTVLIVFLSAFIMVMLKQFTKRWLIDLL